MQCSQVHSWKSKLTFQITFVNTACTNFLELQSVILDESPSILFHFEYLLKLYLKVVIDIHYLIENGTEYITITILN